MASSAQQKQFINEIAYIIQEEAKARGYQVCSPIIAQACIESAYGTSSLGYRWHNYFGMKCGSSWKGKSINLSTKEEYQPGQLTTIRDNFRVYDSMEEGVKGSCIHPHAAQGPDPSARPRIAFRQPFSQRLPEAHRSKRYGHRCLLPAPPSSQRSACPAVHLYIVSLIANTSCSVIRLAQTSSF